MGRNVKITNERGEFLEMWKERAGAMGVKLDDNVDIAVGTFVEADMLRIRDHLNKAYPVQNEDLARVEAERDTAAQLYNGAHNALERAEAQRDTAQAQLAEAVGLLELFRKFFGEPSKFADLLMTHNSTRVFLARHTQAEQQEECAHEFVPFQPACLKCGELYQAEQQEAQGAQAGDELDVVAEAIFNADKDNWYSVGPYSQLHANDKARLRVMARAALATQPAAGEPVATVSRFFVSEWTDGSGQGGGWRYELEVLGDLPVGKSNLYAAPPAAAHGDEAVRKDAKLPPLPESTGDITYRRPTGYIGRVEGFNRIQMKEYALAAIDAAMRAQGDGEDK